MNPNYIQLKVLKDLPGMPVGTILHSSEGNIRSFSLREMIDGGFAEITEESKPYAPEGFHYRTTPSLREMAWNPEGAGVTASFRNVGFLVPESTAEDFFTGRDMHGNSVIKNLPDLFVHSLWEIGLLSDDKGRKSGHPDFLEKQ